MRKTCFLTFILIIASSAFGCGASSTTTSRPLASTAETERASVETEKIANKPAAPPEMKSDTMGAPTTLAGRSVTQNATALRVSSDQTSLTQAQTALIDTAPTDRKIIRNADLSLESETPDETLRRITNIAEANGGFVVESQQTSSDARATKRDIVTMSVRVPSSKFADTLAQIHAAVDKIIFENGQGRRRYRRIHRHRGTAQSQKGA